MFVRRGSQVEINSPAKLNLFLEVLTRRPDGYHEIETLMVAVTIYDSLFLSPNSDGSLRLACEWGAGLEAQDIYFRPGSVFGDLPPSAGNIVIRALERLRLRAGIVAGATVWLKKRIPSAAGLGGASSDAAATLVAANEAWGLNWSRTKLAEVAAELGSDIPFFLGDATRPDGKLATAICRGRGERIELVLRWPTLHFVVLRPPVGLSTPEVYRHCRPAQSPADVTKMVAAARRGDVVGVAAAMRNGLQASAEQVSPWIERVRREFQRLEFVGHQMSGSGSSYFGICRDAGQARRLAARLRGRGLGAVFCCRSIA